MHILAVQTYLLMSVYTFVRHFSTINGRKGQQIRNNAEALFPCLVV